MPRPAIYCPDFRPSHSLLRLNPGLACDPPLLLLCPFCGGKARLEVDGVQCQACGGWARSVDDWNRRETPEGVLITP